MADKEEKEKKIAPKPKQKRFRSISLFFFCAKAFKFFWGWGVEGVAVISTVYVISHLISDGSPLTKQAYGPLLSHGLGQGMNMHILGPQ